MMTLGKLLLNWKKFKNVNLKKVTFIVMKNVQKSHFQFLCEIYNFQNMFYLFESCPWFVCVCVKSKWQKKYWPRNFERYCAWMRYTVLTQLFIPQIFLIIFFRAVLLSPGAQGILDGILVSSLMVMKKREDNLSFKWCFSGSPLDDSIVQIKCNVLWLTICINIYDRLFLQFMWSQCKIAKVAVFIFKEWNINLNQW